MNLGAEQLASRSSHFMLQERTPGTRWIGGCVVLRIGPDVIDMKKIPTRGGDQTQADQRVANNFTG
jgi:hypothetical protein